MTTESWLILALIWVLTGMGAYAHARWNYKWERQPSLLFALGGPITLFGGIFNAWLPVLAASSIAAKLFGAYALWQLMAPLLQGESQGITLDVWLKGFAAWYFTFSVLLLAYSLWAYHRRPWPKLGWRPLGKTYYWLDQDSQPARTIKRYMFAPEMLIFTATISWRLRHRHKQGQEYA